MGDDIADVITATMTSSGHDSRPVSGFGFCAGDAVQSGYEDPPVELRGGVGVHGTGTGKPSKVSGENPENPRTLGTFLESWFLGVPR